MKMKKKTIIIIFAAIGIVFGFGMLMAGNNWYRYRPNAANCIFFILSLYLIPFIHEAGHVLGALVSGWRISRVTFGWGKELWRKRVFGILVVFNRIPGGGLTYLGKLGTPFSNRNISSISAGECSSSSS